MFSTEEIDEFNETFKQLGITNKEEQEKILSFMYNLGVILYENNCTDETE